MLPVNRFRIHRIVDRSRENSKRHIWHWHLSSFWEILKSNIDELAMIKQHYQQAGLIEGDRIGVAGTSIGGMTTLGRWFATRLVSVAADFMGSGYFT